MYNPKKYWDNRASEWLKQNWDTETQWREIRKYINPDWKVLELGCGDGRWSEYFKNYEGWDISEKLIKHCRTKYPDKKFKVKEISGIVPDEYDLIFSYTSLEHVPSDILSNLKLPDCKYLFIEPYQKSNVEYCFGREYSDYFDVECLEVLGRQKVWGKMVKPEVSVIMPTYNQQVYLAEAIQSVLEQSYKHFELIIVNDGSTEDIRDIIDHYIKLDNRIRYYEKKHSGLPDTLNYGIEKSSKNIIIRADDDDIQEAYKIDILLSYLIGYDFCYGGYYHSNIHGEITEEIKPNSFTLDNIRNNRVSGSCSLAVYKNVFDKVKYRSDMMVNEDLAFWWDMYKKGMKGLAVDVPVYRYRLLESGISYSRKDEVKKNTNKIMAEISKWNSSQ